MPASAQPHVLVVDDDPSIREALALALAGPYTVHTAATGAEACTILRTRPVAGIVLDAILADEHGLDLVDRFRALSHAPILILTGHSTEELAIRAVWAKVSGYLKKPVNLHDLHSALGQLVSSVSLPPDSVTHAHLHLADHPDTQFTARDLARHVGLSERQLRRRFREAYGTTPCRHLTDLELHRAAGLLRTTELAIKEVAWQLRYRSVAWFATIFKRAYGFTPSEFRARHRSEGKGGEMANPPRMPDGRIP